MSWRKVKLGDVCTIEKGKIGIMKAVPGDFPLVVLGEERRSHNEFHFDGKAVIIPLVSSTGHGHRSLKRIHYEEGKFAVGDILCAVMPKNYNELDSMFLYRYLDVNKEKELVGRMKGMANVSLPIKSLAEIEIPLPLLDEQKTIIKKLSTINNQTIPLTSELTRQLDFVKQLRQSFLREAMQGKLVPQDPKDESASKLLQKIKAEKDKLIKEKKIKQGKMQIAELQEEILFEIPNNWVWCRLDDICKYITDGTHQTPTYTERGRIFLSAQNVKPFKFMPEDHKYVSEEAYQEYTKNRTAELGDILVARVGAGIGEAAVIDKGIDFCFYVSLGLVQPFKEFINSDYLAYVFNSPYGVRYAKGNISSKGGSAGNFNLGRIRSLLIPLPPLPEQHRIVAKLEQLMQLCDDLEQSIRQSKEQTNMLLQSAMREALKGNEAEAPKE